MSSGVRLSDYSTTPLYNIKAVVQATNISPSTLRAWERRYNMCEPQRSDSGYRLYSERDVAVIRWLKSQVDAGMSISQAVTWLEDLSEQAYGRANAVLPLTPGTIGIAEIATPRPAPRTNIRSLSALSQELTQALLAYDDTGADQIMAEAFSMYSMEEIGEHLITPVLVEIGDKWHIGEASVADEHFATNYLRLRLSALFRTVAHDLNGPLIWVSCAPGEFHEMAPLLLGIYLRRSGYRVHYFGQNLPAEELTSEMAKHDPDMLLFSATTRNAATELGRLTTELTQPGAKRPLIGYGGQIFNTHPELCANVKGIFMGKTAQESLKPINEILLNQTRPTHNGR